MDNRELFAAALGLEAPWRLTSVEFDADGERLDMSLDFERGARFACPEGDAEGCPVHDTAPRSWRHLDFFQHQAFLTARVPRVRCPTHGVRQVEVPWARPDSGFTLLFEAFLMTLLGEMPVKAAARIVREHDTRLWRVLHHYVEKARAATSAATVTRVGIDETSSRRGHNYITLFCDLDVPRLVFATETRLEATVRRFAKDLREHGGDARNVTEVSIDMSPSFIKGVTKYLPNAEITFDRYHLVQKINAAIDKVRRSEIRSRPELRRTKYIWLKNPARLKADEQAKLEFLQAQEQGLRTADAYRVRMEFDRYFTVTPDLAEPYLRLWYLEHSRSDLEPIRDFANTVFDHWDGVLRWHQSRVSNGVLEAFNSLVQSAKRRARGYRTTKNLIAMAYLVVGKLNMRLATHPA